MFKAFDPKDMETLYKILEEHDIKLFREETPKISGIQVDPSYSEFNCTITDGIITSIYCVSETRTINYSSDKKELEISTEKESFRCLWS